MIKNSKTLSRKLLGLEAQSQSIIKSPLSILSPIWSGLLTFGGTTVALGISLGGSVIEILAGRVRAAKGFVLEEKEGDRFVLSRRASDQLNPSPPVLPTLPPCLTSLRACAPKLTRLANDGETGGLTGTSVVSSMTAASSPKLFLNSGEPEPEEVAMLARRCFAKAMNGEDWVGLVPLRPTVVTELPRWGGGGATAEGGEDEAEE